MPKLTVRFLIDGNQVDEVEVEEPKETDLQNFIARLKDSLSECVTDLRLDADIDEGFAGLHLHALRCSKGFVGGRHPSRH